MEPQKTSTTGPIVGVVVLLLLVIGGGIYFFGKNSEINYTTQDNKVMEQKNTAPQPTKATSTDTQITASSSASADLNGLDQDLASNDTELQALQ